MHYYPLIQIIIHVMTTTIKMNYDLRNCMVEYRTLGWRSEKSLTARVFSLVSFK
jgi:hypothetical protein